MNNAVFLCCFFSVLLPVNFNIKIGTFRGYIQKRQKVKSPSDRRDIFEQHYYIYNAHRAGKEDTAGLRQSVDLGKYCFPILHEMENARHNIV